MDIRSFQTSADHWSSSWIPISPGFRKGTTYIWASGGDLHALARVTATKHHRLELGDVWLADKHRGVEWSCGRKCSWAFLDHVLAKATHRNVVFLRVLPSNIPALRLYVSLGFTPYRTTEQWMFMKRQPHDDT